jgi:hypothetical protein
MGEQPMSRRGWVWNKKTFHDDATYRQWCAEHEAERATRHGQQPAEKQLVVSGRWRWKRRRMLERQVQEHLREGYVLQSTTEGIEKELFAAGRCPTLSPDHPEQVVIVGTLRR